MRAIKTIEKELKEYEGLLEAAVEKDEVEFMEGAISDLKTELDKAKASEKKPAAKKPAAKKPAAKKPATKKPAAKKPATKKPAKEEHFIEVDGKKIYQSDPKFCDALIKQWEDKVEKRKKLAGKKKTRSVMQQVASSAAATVVKGIKTIETKDLEKNPQAQIKKVKRLEAASKEYISAYKDIVGEKLSQAEIKEEFEGVDKIISQIEKKYIKSKK